MDNKLRKTTKIPLPNKGEPYLLTPGPLSTSFETKEKMLVDLGSWDQDFKKITSKILDKLIGINGRAS